MPVGPIRPTPPGAWDTHIHIYDPRFPVAPNSVFQPPVATAGDYRAVQRRLGLDRVLIVQSSAHGTDHACLLDAIATLGEAARGIAMVGASVTDGELKRLTNGGVRGARFLMTPGGVADWDELEPLAHRTAGLGWHVNLQLEGGALDARAALISPAAWASRDRPHRHVRPPGAA